ncbi:hypothetical protein QWJ90_05370 [Microbacterium oryzae]|uniref:hypothetical protein n=1 Tax=Microbacterium oryzae TaxID=743009 RepID=UPI0025AFF28A|nr:hypothetical protein [Microbacterium oryzae]MDN3310350.1 hypothetical protein [Microbacterium oryzae]
MRRHLRWIIPLLCVPVIYLAGALTIAAISEIPDATESVGLGLTVLSVIAAMVVGMLVAAVLTVTGALRVRRESRRRRGILTPFEQVQQARAQQELARWEAARALRSTLLRRQVPATMPVWHVVPEGDEVFFFELEADYERYYGQDVTYTSAGGVFAGRPAFVLAGLAASAVVTASRRSAANAAAAEQWREWEHVRVLVSNRRLVCLVRGQWMSFHYGAMTAIYPEVSSWTLVTEFGGTIAPLRLRGADVPLAAVMTVFAAYGEDGLARHPGLAPLS